MAKSIQLIQTVTVDAGGAASITFTNIPQNFTDLKLVFSTKSTVTGNRDILIAVNGSTSNWSARLLYTGGDGIAYSVTSTYLIGETSGSNYSGFGSGEIYIPNYAGSTNKSFSADSVNENNSTSAYALFLNANLWSNTTAISSLTLTLDSGNFAQYSTAYLYGIGGAKASGGTITYDDRYTYHTFTSTGSFTALERIKDVEIMIVAGGGAGAGNSGGGGGAGGLVYSNNQTLLAGTTYTALIGAGGAGAAGSTNQRGANGSNSVFSAFTAFGGGGGGNRGGGSTIGNGASGGSGGGGSVDGYTGGTATQLSGYMYAGYGNAGGSSPGSANPGGGGGGAGAAGQDGGSANSSGGDGGVGTTLFSTWGLATSTGQNVGGLYYYAGGGGGSFNTAGTGEGGLGGGASNGGGNNTNGASATANTGGGGGAATGISTYSGGSGGSGLIIVRYPSE